MKAVQLLVLTGHPIRHLKYWFKYILEWKNWKMYYNSSVTRKRIETFLRLYLDKKWGFNNSSNCFEMSWKYGLILLIASRLILLYVIIISNVINRTRYFAFSCILWLFSYCGFNYFYCSLLHMVFKVAPKITMIRINLGFHKKSRGEYDTSKRWSCDGSDSSFKATFYRRGRFLGCIWTSVKKHLQGCSELPN